MGDDKRYGPRTPFGDDAHLISKGAQNQQRDVWTPIDAVTGERLSIPRTQVTVVGGDPLDEDPPYRQLGKRGVVEWNGTQYEVRGISCGLPSCNCDAEIVTTQSLGYMLAPPDTDALLALRATGDLSRPAGCAVAGLVQMADSLESTRQTLISMLATDNGSQFIQIRSVLRDVVTAMCSLRIFAAYSPSRESLLESLHDALGTDEARDAWGTILTER